MLHWGFTQQKYAELLGVGRCLISIWEIELHNVAQENLHEGENKLGLLMKALFAAHRFEEADEAATDEAKRNQLYKEFGIQ